MRKLNLKGKVDPRKVPHNCLLLIEGGKEGGEDMVLPLKDYPGGFDEISRGVNVTLIRCAYVRRVRDGVLRTPKYKFVNPTGESAKDCHLALLLYAHTDEQLYRVVLDPTHIPAWSLMIRDGKKQFGHDWFTHDLYMRLRTIMFNETGGWGDHRRRLGFKVIESSVIPRKTLNKLRATYEGYFKGDAWV